MEPPAPPPPQQELAFLRPAIRGGILLGVLSALPFIAAGNCLCCLWIQGGGGLAAWLVNQQRPGTLKYGDGAYAGVLAGLIGTLVYTLINIPIQTIIYTPEAAAEAVKMFNTLFPDIPADAQQEMAAFFEPGFARLLLMTITFSVVGGLFSMIGGILTVAAINKQTKNGPSAGASGK
jgi:hypothetical protein